MKKITTLFAGLFAFMLSASAAQPQVIVNTAGNYEVSIDGRFYNTTISNVITDLSQGTHNLDVYQVISKGILGIGKKRNLVSSRQFTLRNNDVVIDVNQNGQTRISQNGLNNNNDNWNNDNNRNNGGQYGNSEGKGRGHKYGHYKNKNKKEKHNDQREKDDNENDDNNNRRRSDD